MKCLSSNSSKSFALVVILIFLIILTPACNLSSYLPIAATPEPSQEPLPTETPILQQSEVIPTPTIAIPPALVEIQPIENSELSLNNNFVLYFNQAMDLTSVESAFSTQPQIPGNLEWLDEATLRFTPSQSLPTNTTISLKLGNNAKSQNGLPLKNSVTVNYHTADYLRVAEQLPRPDEANVNTSSAIAVTFNRPIAPTDNLKNFSPAFSIEPLAEGSGQWLNNSTYVFYPQPALKSNTQYSIKISPDLKSIESIPFSPGQESTLTWNFSTEPAALLSVEPENKEDIFPDTTFGLTFNHPIDAESIKENLVIQNEKGEPITGEYTWNETYTHVSFQPAELLERGTTYNLILLGSIKTQTNATLGNDYAAQFSTLPPLSITETLPNFTQLASNTYSSITLKMSAPLSENQDLERLIGVRPSIRNRSVFIDSDKTTLYLNGNFIPNTEYLLVASEELADHWGQSLDDTYVEKIKTGSAPPAFSSPIVNAGNPIIYLPTDDIILPAYATNLRSLKIVSNPLVFDEFVQLSETSSEERLNYSLSNAATWEKRLYLTPNRSEVVEVSLTPPGTELSTGLYYNMISSPELEETEFYVPTNFLSVVSSVHMLMKTSTEKTLIWAYNLENNQPTINASVLLFDQTGALLGSSETDQNGLCQIDLPNTITPYDTIYAVIGKPGDADFGLATSTWGEGLSPRSFNTIDHYSPTNTMAYLYSDKTVYQPGQTIYFRAIVRQQTNGRYHQSDLEQINVQIMGDYSSDTEQNPLLASFPLQLSTYGTTNGSYTIPANAAPGHYSIIIDEIESASLSFQVSKYQTSEINIEAQFSDKEIKIGTDIQASIQTKSYYNTPIGYQNIQWTLVAKKIDREPTEGYATGTDIPFWLHPPGWLQSEKDSPIYISSDYTNTDNDGSLSLNIAADTIKDAVEMGSTYELILEVNLLDNNATLSQQISTSSTLHPDDIYIGIKNESWGLPAGEEIGFSIQTMDWNNQTVADQPLNASFRKVNWRQEENLQTNWPEMVPEYNQIGSTDFSTGENGRARLVFTPPEPGIYQLQVSSESGGLSQVIVWVSGEENTVWPTLPNQHLPLSSDADEYNPGQIAKVIIPNPFKGETQALITIERATVMRSQIITITGSSFEYLLPLTDEDAPNIYVSVTLLGQQANELPDFRQGYIELNIKPVSQTLQVELEANPGFTEPGEDVLFTIQVKDSQGKPAEGEFSLAIVDKKALSIENDLQSGIIEAFYGNQPIGVTNSMSLAAYGRRVPIAPPDTTKLSVQTQNILQIDQDIFESAHWFGSIITDINGFAEFSLALPDKNTTWVAIVRGVTSDTKVGTAKVELSSLSSIYIQPNIPSYLIEGDHIQLKTTITNNTDQNLETKVTIQANGITLHDAEEETKTVNLKPFEKQTISWEAIAQKENQANLMFTAQAGNLSVTSQPEAGIIPILHYSAQQKQMISGILSENSQQLEYLNMPRSFTPTGAQLKLEISPSMTAVILAGLQGLESYPGNLTEPVTSRILPNLETYKSLSELGIESQEINNRLEQNLQNQIQYLSRYQNEDGGWGWSPGDTSDSFITSYVLFTLSKAAQMGVHVDADIFNQAQTYLTNSLTTPEMIVQNWRMDRLAFQYFALQQSGKNDIDAAKLHEYRDRLSPWSYAMLALTLDNLNPGDGLARLIVSDLKAMAIKENNTTHWENAIFTQQNMNTPIFTTAIITYALEQIEPASPEIMEAVQYLLQNRNTKSQWNSSFESAWTILVLNKTLKNTGDYQANFAFNANLNDTSIVNGQTSDIESLKPTTTTLAVENLNPNSINILSINRDEGSGNLYYQANFEYYRQISNTPSIQRGIIVNRRYYETDKECQQQLCQPTDTFSLEDPQMPIEARLTITIPTNMYYLVVEDFAPAGTTIIAATLSNDLMQSASLDDIKQYYDATQPFKDGWGWWHFNNPQISYNQIQWTAESIPAGTYELTYFLIPQQSGDFNSIPAHVYQYYYPKIEGKSAGSILKISP